MWHWRGWLHGLALTRCCLQQCPHCGTHINTSTDSHIPSSSWAGRDRRLLVQLHTWHSLGSQAHAQLWIPQEWAQPLCPSGTLIPGPLTCPMGPLYSAAGPAWCLLANTHTLIPQAPHTHRFPPNTSTDPPPTWQLCVDPEPPTHQLVQLGVCCWVTHAHTRFGEGTDAQPLSATRTTQALTHSPAPVTYTEPFTSVAVFLGTHIVPTRCGLTPASS